MKAWYYKWTGKTSRKGGILQRIMKNGIMNRNESGPVPIPEKPDAEDRDEKSGYEMWARSGGNN